MQFTSVRLLHLIVSNTKQVQYLTNLFSFHSDLDFIVAEKEVFFGELIYLRRLSAMQRDFTVAARLKISLSLIPEIEILIII